MIPKKTILKTQNVKYGDKVCIYELPSDLYIVTLSFEEGFPSLNIQKNCPTDDIKIIHKKFTSIVEDIKKMKNKVYLTYDYLFAYQKNELKFFSCSYKDILFSFKKIKKIGDKLNFPFLKITWCGKYTYVTPFAFFQDIFIQKYD